MPEKYSIEWSSYSISDLDCIFECLALNDSLQVAEKLYIKLTEKIDSLYQYPLRCRIVPELRRIGILEFRELIVSPFRIFYRIYQTKVVLVGILDGRRDLEEVLIQRSLLFP